MEKSAQRPRTVDGRGLQQRDGHGIEPLCHDKYRKCTEYTRQDDGPKRIHDAHCVRHQIARNHRDLKGHQHQNDVQREQRPPPAKPQPGKRPCRGRAHQHLSQHLGEHDGAGVPEHGEKLRCVQQKLRQWLERGPAWQQGPESAALCTLQHRAQRGPQLVQGHQRACAHEPQRPPHRQRRQKKEQHKHRAAQIFSFHRASSPPHSFCSSRIAASSTAAMSTAAAHRRPTSKSRNQLLNRCCNR